MLTNNAAFAAETFERIQRAISQNRLVLPSLPDALLAVRAALNDDYCSHGRLAEIISRDTAISARLLKVVNSSAMRGQREINDIRGAVTRLGTKLVQTLVTSLTITQMMFSSIANSKGVFTELLKNHHRRTVQVASLCYALAANASAMDRDEALLAGLVHDIGVLPLVQYAEQYAGLGRNYRAVRQLVDALHAQAGAYLLEHWGFAQQLVDVAAEHEDVFRNGASCEPDYVDLVIVANLYLDSGFDETQSQLLPEQSGIPAVRKLYDRSSLTREPLDVVRQQTMEILRE